MRNIHKVTRAKQRENVRQARYFKDDIEQPFDDRGRRNPKFERIYAKKIRSIYGDKYTSVWGSGNRNAQVGN